MSTNVYLSRLDINQLRYARDRANELIAEKESQPKKLVWAVEDNDAVLDYFPDEQYFEAARFLMECALACGGNPDLDPRGKQFHLTYRWVIESEYADYVGVQRSKS
jgi:hypothetical protein